MAMIPCKNTILGMHMCRMIPPLAQGRDCAMLFWATVGVSLEQEPWPQAHRSVSTM